MTWPNFYLTCFLLGFSLSVVSFVLGSLNLHGLHLFHGHVGHAGHLGHAGHVGATHSAAGHAHQAAAVSPFNFATISAFLAWFGGAGYLLTRYGGLVAIPALVLALVTGIAGGALLDLFHEYVHGGIDRLGFLYGAGKFAVGGLNTDFLHTLA